MKIENRDRLNNIRGIAHSIDVFNSDRPLMIQEEGK